MIAIDVTIKVNGGIFSRNIERTVRTALYEEAIDKIADRMMRGGRGLGVRRNTLSRGFRGELEATVESTRRFPRTRGTAWTRKNIGIAKAMAPRVLRKSADRIVAEMGR